MARFRASRSSYNANAWRHEILRVTSVDEDYSDVPNDTVTHVSAVKALRIAAAAAARVGEPADPRWKTMADGRYVPFDAQGGHHLDFDPSVAHDQNTWAGSALPMLSYPSLDLPMSSELRRRDYDYALAPIPHSHRDPNSMGLAPLSIAAATLGDHAEASAWFERNLTADVIKPPFNVRTETAGNNTGYFLTAAGGLLQNVIYGFSGLRIQSQGLVTVYPPMLPPGWNSLALRHVSFRGHRYDLVVERDGHGHGVLTRQPVPPPRPARIRRCTMTAPRWHHALLAGLLATLTLSAAAAPRRARPASRPTGVIRRPPVACRTRRWPRRRPVRPFRGGWPKAPRRRRSPHRSPRAGRSTTA